MSTRSISPRRGLLILGFWLSAGAGCTSPPGTDPTTQQSGGTASGSGGVLEGTGGTAQEGSGAALGSGGLTDAGSGGADTAGGGAGTGGSAPPGGGEGAGGASGGQTSTRTDVCSQPGVLLCEDFEDFTVGQAPGAPWTLAVNGLDGTAVIDGTTPASSGTHSVVVTSAGNYQTFVAITGAPVFPAPSSTFYVRVFMRLSEPMTGGHNTYFKAGAAGAIGSDHETRVGVMLEMLMINQPADDRGVLSNQGYWTDNLPGTVIREQTWTCVEGLFDPPHSTVQFWVDGAEVPDLHVTDWQQDPIGAFHFGFEKYAGPDTQIWYDDIVISQNPIGCEPIAPAP